MPNEMDSTAGNVFHPSFLERLRRRDEPSGAGEAEHAGPWSVREVAGGYGVYRESDPEDARPEAVFEHREHALLLAAVLPGVGREPSFHLDARRGADGYGIETVWGETWTRIVGHLRTFEPEAVSALHLAEVLARTPASLALLLEGAGPKALELSGEILARRVGEEE